MKRSNWQDGDVAARLLPTLADFDGGWRAVGAYVNDSGGSMGGELERFLAGRVPEREVVAVADSTVFVRSPARLAYAVAAVLATDRAGADAFELVASEEFAFHFAEGVAAGAVVAPGAAELLGSTNRPIELSELVVPGVEAAANRTAFAGASAEGVVPVHVDLVVLHSGPRLLMVWLADAPDPFPEVDRAHLLTRLARRLRRTSMEQPPLA